MAWCGDLLNRRGLAQVLGLDQEAATADVVAAAYRRWGRAMFDRLEGSFGMVVHDPGTRLTLAGIDPCCVASLYACRVGDVTMLASEAKAFRAHPGFCSQLDREAVGELLAFGHTLGGRPLFAGVLGLPHGGHFEVDDQGLRVVRHWDARDEAGGRLRGGAYVDALEAVVREVAAETYGEPAGLVPLTGGLDSRLWAAAAPADRQIEALTFGAAGDRDCVLAARIAAARGLPHRLLPLEPAYVQRFAYQTVWALEGRLSPVGNITGSLMADLSGAPYFVSGAGAAAGRHFGRSRMLVPDWAWDRATGRDFELYYATRVKQYGLPWSSMPTLVRDGARVLTEAVARRDAVLRQTRGLAAVDRQDLYTVQERERYGQTGLSIADLWVTARAPQLTRRWVTCMLSGAASERIDDRARLRLIRRMDARVAGVPWSLTHLSLGWSAHALTALRAAGVVTRRRLALPGEGAATGDIVALNVAASRPARGAASRLQHKLYSHGDRRDAWLRGPSRPIIDDVLLSPRLAAHGVFDPQAVRDLVQSHLTGGAHASALGVILGVELWQRLFEDGDPPHGGGSPSHQPPPDHGP